MAYRLDAAVFRKQLAQAGFKSLSQVAAQSGVHRNTLQNFLSGKGIFSSAFLKLACALGCDPLQLIRSSTAIEGLFEIRGIISLLESHDPQLAVVVFGSRASGKAKPYSDWDIGICRHPKPISGREYLMLKRVVAEKSDDMVRLVDLVNLDSAPLWFLKELPRELVFVGGNRETYRYFKGVLDGIQKSQAA